MTTDEPESSLALPAVTAVEVEIQRTPAAFAQGLFVGYAIAATLAAVWVAVELAPTRGMAGDLYGGETMHRSWWFLSTPWLWGVPSAGALAAAFLVWRRPRRLWPYFVLALVLTAAVVGTWWYATSPLRELADNIQE